MRAARMLLALDGTLELCSYCLKQIVPQSADLVVFWKQLSHPKADLYGTTLGVGTEERQILFVSHRHQQKQSLCKDRCLQHSLDSSVEDTLRCVHVAHLEVHR